MDGSLIEQSVTQSDVMGSLITQPANMPMSMENPNFDLDDPDAYDLLTDGAETPSGVRVSNESALMHPAVFQATTMISGDVAGLPLGVFRQELDGNRMPVRGQLHELVHWQPNQEMNAFRFWRRMLSWKLLWGNAYAFIMRDGNGQARELLPLLPDRTNMERIDGQLYCVTEVDGRIRPIVADDVFHLEGISIDTLQGYNFVKAARYAIGLAIAEIGFASRFYKNGGRVGGILELPAGMTKTARDKVEEGFRRTYGTNEAFKTIVLRENAKFHSAQVSPEDAQVVDARQESVRDIARLFNVRPGKLGEESRTSFASKSEDNRDYYDTTLRPHLRDIVMECRSKLLSPSQQRMGMYFEHDTRQLLAMDFASMADAIVKLRSAEVINANESRQLINMNKREDDRGSEYRNPNINTTEDGDEQPAEDSGATDEPAARAFRSLLSNTVKRMAAGVAKRAKSHATDPEKFCDWIDNGYMNQKDSISDAIGEVAQAAAQAVEIEDPAVASSEITDQFLAESLQILQTVAASTTLPELRVVVDANMSEWAAVAGERYAKQLIK